MRGGVGRRDGRDVQLRGNRAAMRSQLWHHQRRDLQVRLSADALPRRLHGRRHVRGRLGDNQPLQLRGGDRRSKYGGFDDWRWEGGRRILLILSEGVHLPVLRTYLGDWLPLQLLQHPPSRKRNRHRHWTPDVSPLPLASSTAPETAAAAAAAVVAAAAATAVATGAAAVAVTAVATRPSHCPHHGRRHMRGRPGDNEPLRLLGGDRRSECGDWKAWTTRLESPHSTLRT